MYASVKNVLYYFDVCGMSPEAIAQKLSVDVQKIREILGKTPVHRPLYTPRMRYNGWVNDK